MEKVDFFSEIHNKVAAIGQFPGYFDRSYNISVLGDAKRLRTEYLENIKEIKKNSCNNTESFYKCASISRAYDYVNDGLCHERKKYQWNSNLIRDVLDTYDSLTSEISEYHFESKSGRSYGAIQNEVNSKILFDISLLRPMLFMTLENLDTYFSKSLDDSMVNVINGHLCNQLNELIASLCKACSKLRDAQANYYDIWDKVNVMSRSCATYNDLGKAKGLWKQARNAACCAILEFYMAIYDIAISIPTRCMVNPISKINSIYAFGIDNIMYGPYWYCYLSDEKRQEQNTDGLKRKLETICKRSANSQD